MSSTGLKLVEESFGKTGWEIVDFVLLNRDSVRCSSPNYFLTPIRLNIEEIIDTTIEKAIAHKKFCT